LQRDDIECIAESLGCKPVAHHDSFTADKLGSAGLVEEITLGGSGSGTKVVKIEQVPHPEAVSKSASLP
jgi:T-complex protein 1 subunit delta